MTRLNLYHEYSGGEQQEPTNESSTINNDDVDNTEAPASVENVNVFTSDPSLPHDPRYNCTCIQGPATQGYCNQERCECIDCFCFACNCSAQNALGVDDSLEQASVILPPLPVREGTLATLRRARENPQLARIAEQMYEVASAQEVPPRRRDPLLFEEDGPPVTIVGQMMAAEALDNSRRYRHDPDPEDRELREEWDDMCRMNLRRPLSSPRHHLGLPHPAITPEPGNTEEPSNISPGSRFGIPRIGRALLGVVNNFCLDEAALERARSARRARRAEQQYHRNVADWMQQRGPYFPPDRCPISEGIRIPVGISTVPPPLSEQSLAELRRAGLRDALEEPRPNPGGEESGYGSTETSPENASEHQSNKRQRTSYFGERE